MSDNFILVSFVTAWSAISWIAYAICIKALQVMQEEGEDKELELMMQVPVGAAIMKTWLLVASIFWPVPLFFAICSIIKQKITG